MTTNASSDGLVLTPMRVEQAALRGVVPSSRLRLSGYGPARSRAFAASLPAAARPVLVAGLAGGLTRAVRPGDVVVASELHDTSTGATLTLPGAPLLAGALRRRGLTVHVGPVVSTDGVVDGPRRTALGTTGALAVDLESAPLAAAAHGGPVAVVRVVVDTPDRPLLRPGTAVRGVQALRTLRRCAPAFEDWFTACRPRTLVLAAPRSFCAGVARAVDIVERGLTRFGAPVYVRRQVVHNAHVVRDLERRGAVFVEEVAEVPRGAVVVLAAHGVAPAVRDEAAARDLTVVDATCPLVSKVHTEVKRYSARGDTVLLIGHRDHEEVVGTVGEAPGDVLVVQDVREAARVAPPDPQHVAYVMQTTLAVEEAGRIADVLRGRFPTLQSPRRDDICYATTNRQQAVRKLATRSDVVLVVGSANSSNSQRLVEVADRDGACAHLVDDVEQLDLRWVAQADTIGITAGASAPPHLVDELVDALTDLGGASVHEEHVVDEDIHFTLPREVS